MLVESTRPQAVHPRAEVAGALGLRREVDAGDGAAKLVQAAGDDRVHGTHKVARVLRSGCVENN